MKRPRTPTYPGPMTRIVDAVSRSAAVAPDSDAVSGDGVRCKTFKAEILDTEQVDATTYDLVETGVEVDVVYKVQQPVQPGERILIGQMSDGTWTFVLKSPRCKAKWIKFQYTHGVGYAGVLDHWSGTDPSGGDETPTIEYPLGEPCEDAEVIAFCDENTGKYQAISTESAMLGPPATMNIVQALAFDGCGVNYIYQSAKVFPCGSESSLINTSPSLTEQTVLTGMEFLEEIEGCEGQCTYEWSQADQRWYFVSSDCDSGSGCECPSEDPPPPDDTSIDGQTTSVPCVRSDGLEPRDASFCFTTKTVLVCAALASSATYCVPLTECSDPEY